jgi:hypothetical protein
MSLQKYWGNFHLTVPGVMLSALLVGCDEGVAQNAAPSAPLMWSSNPLVSGTALTVGLKRWKASSCDPASPATLTK